MNVEEVVGGGARGWRSEMIMVVEDMGGWKQRGFEGEADDKG